MSATLAIMVQARASDGGAGAITVVGIIVVVAALWILGLVDALLVPDDSLYKSGSKVMWVCLIIFLGILGAIIYAAAGAPTPDARRRYDEFRQSRPTSNAYGLGATPVVPPAAIQRA